jgi:hypothetical protein
MPSAEELMQRLAVSKKIMDRHNDIKRGDAPNSLPMVENYEVPAASYNLPQDLINETQTTQQRSAFDPTKPIDETKILNSKLPEEIKKLMIEQPIVQPNMTSNTVISDDIIEGAQRLMKMGMNTNTTTSQESVDKGLTTNPKPTTQSSYNLNEMRNMIRDIVRDTVRDVIREELIDAGVISESTEDANETIQFKVGKHVFMGKVTKIQKIK